MGSWNKTCGLSRLPIFSGEDVYVFFLTPNAIGGDRCYSTALWRPLLINLEAKYDDYGGFEDCSDDIVSSSVLAAFKQSIQPMSQGSNQFHDIPVVPEEMTLESIQEAIHEGRLFFKKRGEETKPNSVAELDQEDMIDSVFLRKDIVDHIIENYQYDRYVGNGKGTHGYGNNYVVGSFKECFDLLPEFVDLLWEKMTAKDKMSSFESSSMDVFPLPEKMEMLRWHLSVDYKNMRLVDPFWACRELADIDDVTKEEFTEVALALYTSHVRGSLINSFMEMTRGIWAPGCHEGSQSESFAEYRLLAKAMDQVITECEKRYE